MITIRGGSWVEWIKHTNIDEYTVVILVGDGGVEVLFRLCRCLFS